ncbi:hypothetical protein K439DRAFT_1612930 [Ramaria rubella]|nr:hypothetical protein K439DRAFT_1612930 [Ramaria rubella]
MPQITSEGHIQLQVQCLTPSLGLVGPQDHDYEAYFIQKYDLPGQRSFSNFALLLTPVSNAGSHSHPMHHSVENALCVGEELVKYNQNIVMHKDEAEIWLMQQVDRYINVHNVYGMRTQEAHVINYEFATHFHLNARNGDDGTMIDPMASLLLNNQTATIGTLQGVRSCDIASTARLPIKNPKKNVRQPMTPALLTFPGPPQNVHAKNVFATACQTEITSAINTHRIAKGVSTQHNTRLYALERDTVFNSLTDSEKCHWHEMANQQNSCDFGIWLGKFEVQAHCRNQEHLENTLRAVFEGLIGHGNNQIGDAVVHCQFAYHATGNMVKMFSVKPGLADSINCHPPHCPPLSDFVINYTDNVT